MVITIGIVGVPERRREINNLIAAFQGYPYVYPFYDINHKGSWYGHLGAMRTYENESESTHHLVIEDDVEICDNFIPLLQQAITAVPNQVISVYASRAQKDKVAWAKRNNSSWFRDAHGASGQGVLFPVSLLQDFLLWEKINCPFDMPYEDTRLYGWMKERNLYTWNTVPALIEHTQPMQSMLGFNNKGKVAAWYEREITDIDFTKGLPNPKVFKYIGGIKGYTKYVLQRRNNG